MATTLARKKKLLLQESFADKPDRVDRDAGVIYGVKVLGLVSRNGRKYREEAVQRARPLYEGAKVFVNHESDEDLKRRPDRPLQEHWGVLRNVRYVEGRGLYADLHYLKEHDLTPRLVEQAERFPETFGLSHDAAGDEKIIDGERYVTEIFRVNSVDVVSTPATNDGLFESVREAFCPTGKGGKVKNDCSSRKKGSGSSKSAAGGASKSKASADDAVPKHALGKPGVHAGEDGVVYHNNASFYPVKGEFTHRKTGRKTTRYEGQDGSLLYMFNDTGHFEDDNGKKLGLAKSPKTAGSKPAKKPGTSVRAPEEIPGPIDLGKRDMPGPKANKAVSKKPASGLSADAIKKLLPGAKVVQSKDTNAMELTHPDFKGLNADTPVVVTTSAKYKAGKKVGTQYNAALYVKSTEGGDSHKSVEADSLEGLVAKIKSDFGSKPGYHEGGRVKVGKRSIFEASERGMTTKQYSKIVEGHQEHARLLELAMDNDSMAMSDTMVNVEEDASSSEELSAAFSAAIMRVVNDESLDIAARMAKIKVILKAQEDTLIALGDKAEDPMATGDETADAEMTSEDEYMATGDETGGEATTDEDGEYAADAEASDEETPAEETDDEENLEECEDCDKDEEMENTKKECARLRSENEKLREQLDHASVRALLVESGRRPTEVCMKALLALPVADRPKLLETWAKEKSGASRGQRGERPAASPSRFAESSKEEVLACPKSYEEFRKLVR